MSDSVPPPEMEIAPRRRSPLRNLSAIWLVPILALGVALWVAWSSYSDRGALIEITFGNAAGITAGETAVRYRDVRIGVVESVGFTSGLDTVVVGARIDKGAWEMLEEFKWAQEVGGISDAESIHSSGNAVSAAPTKRAA